MKSKEVLRTLYYIQKASSDDDLRFFIANFTHELSSRHKRKLGGLKK